jgi:hypothetical protein
VRPTGIEPISLVPKTSTLSVELRAQQTDYSIIKIFCKKNNYIL